MVEAMNPQEKPYCQRIGLPVFDRRPRRIHGCTGSHRFIVRAGPIVGTAGFKGPPADGAVEIAYGVAAYHEGKGYATEMAQALVRYAFASTPIHTIRAHTLADAQASKRVLRSAASSILVRSLIVKTGGLSIRDP
jgi:RimJ/RimL family protein N-acetyltransferase